MSDNHNILYILDNSRKVVYFNEEAAEAFPKMRTGISCEEACEGMNYGCSKCPLNSPNGGALSIFNSNIKRWLNISVAYMDYPDHGRCAVITGSFYSSLTHELMSRLKFINEYQFIMEMNLTLDKYALLWDKNFGKPIELAEEPLSKLLKRTANTIVHPDDHDRFIEIFNLETLQERIENAKCPITEEIREKNSSGNWDNVVVTLIPVESSGNSLVMAFFKVNVIDLQKLNEAAKEKDPLTGLLTMNGFKEAAEEYLKKSESKNCIIAMDIEHFRFYNKWYSRWQGDRLLRNISHFLISFDREEKTISGYGGGDNFFIIMPKKSELLKKLTEGLSSLVGSFDEIEGFKMIFGGYSFKKKNEEILDAVDFATTANKRALEEHSKRITWYDEKMIRELEHELTIVPEVERALDEHEFSFFLQPKCSIHDDKIVGAEALVRWENKLRGMIPPSEFIPILENNGLVTKVDRYVWERVCQTLRDWIDRGIKPLPVSVNVSRIDIYSLNVPLIFRELVEKYKLDPKLIEIEITESAFIDDLRIIRSVIQRLRNYGFVILIDDFGSGYSSLNMLKDVPADILKMDIKFFDLNPANFEKGLNIISSVIEMSRNISVPVIAEGVETAEQIGILREIGLNYVQGFYYYKPVSVGDFEKLIMQKEKINRSGIKLL